MTARHAVQLPAITARLAEIVNRAWLEISAHPRAYDAAQYAAVRILADTDIAAGLRATTALDELAPRLTALDALHQPRAWSESSSVTVCRSCRTNWPCRDREILDGTAVTA